MANAQQQKRKNKQTKSQQAEASEIPPTDAVLSYSLFSCSVGIHYFWRGIWRLIERFSLLVYSFRLPQSMPNYEQQTENRAQNGQSGMDSMAKHRVRAVLSQIRLTRSIELAQEAGRRRQEQTKRPRTRAPKQLLPHSKRRLAIGIEAGQIEGVLLAVVL